MGYTKLLEMGKSLGEWRENMVMNRLITYQRKLY